MEVSIVSNVEDNKNKDILTFEQQKQILELDLIRELHEIDKLKKLDVLSFKNVTKLYPIKENALRYLVHTRAIKPRGRGKNIYFDHNEVKSYFLAESKSN